MRNASQSRNDSVYDSDPLCISARRREWLVCSDPMRNKECSARDSRRFVHSLVFVWYDVISPHGWCKIQIISIKFKAKATGLGVFTQHDRFHSPCSHITHLAMHDTFSRFIGEQKVCCVLTSSGMFTCVKHARTRHVAASTRARYRKCVFTVNPAVSGKTRGGKCIIWRYWWRGSLRRRF